MPHSGGNSDDCARGGQQSIAAVLATVSHRSYSNVDTANAALRGQKIGTSTEVGPAEFFELFSDDGRPHRGERPAALREPRPQGEVQRHAGIGYELAQNLDVPVLHMVEQLPDVLQFFATCLPVVTEQVFIGQDSAALGRLSASTADGGPVGGGAHDHVLFFVAADCGAERRHSSSAWRGEKSSRVTPRTGFNSTYSGADR